MASAMNICGRSAGLLCVIALALRLPKAAGQEPVGPAQIQTPPFNLAIPKARSEDQLLPINLPTALALAQARPIDIQLAEQRLQQALALEQRANALWLPTLLAGADYTRHDGQLQAVEGTVFGTSKQSLMVGGGPMAVFAFADAYYAPLAARQDTAARQAGIQTAQNDTMLAVAEAYFAVQQARGEIAAAQDTLQRAEDVVRRSEKLAKALISPTEASRARAELSARRQALSRAREHWRLASAQLARLLRLDPLARIAPVEPPHMQMTLIDADATVDTLIPVALVNRPELASQQALVQATIARLRQEKMRPLIPSLLLRGTATPQGTLGSGTFGGGINSDMSKFGARNDYDIQLVWELPNLGFGTTAKVRERRADNQIALLELLQLEDRIAAEVVQAHAQVQEAADRIKDAAAGVKDALNVAEKNVEGMNTTRTVGEGVGETVLLVIRPQEVIAAVQALHQAYNDYYAAVADYDRAQFRLYRALGRPAQALADGACANR
jgi:outer membrane protein TolC